MNACRRFALAVTLSAAVAGPVSAGDVKIAFRDGRVSIEAANATPRQILSEWARLGGVSVTNLDRLGGDPVSVQLVDVPEAQAIETLLRGTAGFIAALRTTGAPAAGSEYEKILLLPGLAPPPTVASAPAPAPTRPSDAPTRGRSFGGRGFQDETGADIGFGAGPAQGPRGGRRTEVAQGNAPEAPDRGPAWTFPSSGSATPSGAAGTMDPAVPSAPALPPAAGSTVPGLPTTPPTLGKSPATGQAARPGQPTAPSQPDKSA
jgi:hypothetical protein